MIVFWTKAYNAEKTIRRAVESILNQTYGCFIYYVLDNGSTDSTGEIIREYAERDTRIVALKREENLESAFHEYLPLILSHENDGYISLLDADDEYAPDFLEEMIKFVTENKLDVAFCGTEYVEQDGQSRLDIPSETLTFEGSGFAEYFPLYYKYTTRMWAALYSFRVISQLVVQKPDASQTSQEPKEKNKKHEANFGDCIGVLRILSAANRAGLYAKSLHKYYMSSNQLSNAYTPKYFWWINTLQNVARRFLLKYGQISKKNEDFLWIRFLIWIKYILPRIQGANISTGEKLRDLYEIFTNNVTNKLLEQDWIAIGIYTVKEEFLLGVKNWILIQDIGLADCHIYKNLLQVLETQLEETK